MKKTPIILLNVTLCMVHGLCLLLLQDFLTVTLIWPDWPGGRVWLDAVTLGLALLDLAAHHFAAYQLNKRGFLCKYTLPALGYIDYIICGLFCVLWFGLYLYLTVSDSESWLQVAFVIGVNALFILVRRFARPGGGLQMFAR